MLVIEVRSLTRLVFQGLSVYVFSLLDTAR